MSGDALEAALMSVDRVDLNPDEINSILRAGVYGPFRYGGLDFKIPRLVMRFSRLRRQDVLDEIFSGIYDAHDGHEFEINPEYLSKMFSELKSFARGWPVENDKVKSFVMDRLEVAEDAAGPFWTAEQFEKFKALEAEVSNFWVI